MEVLLMLAVIWLVEWAMMVVFDTFFDALRKGKL
jgi:hypothetical protein